MKEMVSEDAVHWATSTKYPVSPGCASSWSTVQLLSEPWILDVEHGQTALRSSAGSEVGYNPSKRGRPSHVYHSYLMAELRLVLEVEVASGKEHTASVRGGPGLWGLLDRLGLACAPFLLRGDNDWGNEGVMSRRCNWALSNWTPATRLGNTPCSAGRRIADPGAALVSDAETASEEPMGLGRLHHAQGQTLPIHSLPRRRPGVRIVALAANWWKFCCLANPDQHREAITSRPLLLQAIGRKRGRPDEPRSPSPAPHGPARRAFSPGCGKLRSS